MKSWLQDNDIEIYSTDNKGKCFVGERFIRTLKNKIYKNMPSISKNVHNYQLDNVVNEYNNTYHRTRCKMKPVDVKSSTYFDFRVQNN